MSIRRHRRFGLSHHTGSTRHALATATREICGLATGDVAWANVLVYAGYVPESGESTPQPAVTAEYLRCPVYLENDYHLSYRVHSFNTYGMSGFESAEPDKCYNWVSHDTEYIDPRIIKKPSDYPLLFDSCNNNVTQQYFHTWGGTSGNIHLKHLQAANFSFLDGRASSFNWTAILSAEMGNATSLISKLKC